MIPSVSTNEKLRLLARPASRYGHLRFVVRDDGFGTSDEVLGVRFSQCFWPGKRNEGRYVLSGRISVGSTQIVAKPC